LNQEDGWLAGRLAEGETVEGEAICARSEIARRNAKMAAGSMLALRNPRRVEDCIRGVP
jgi:hypothetical protein